MELFDVLQKRHTVRNFTGATIPAADLEKMVDAGRYGPSGKNYQPWDFVVVTQRETIEAMTFLADWIAKAAAVIVVVGDPASRWWVEDCAVATYGVLLAVTDLGYGGCWLEGSTQEHERDLKTMLGVPDGLRLFTILPIGVAADSLEKPKKPLEHVIHWEKF